MTETDGGKKKVSSTFSRLTFRNLSLKGNAKDRKTKPPVTYNASKDGVDMNRNEVSSKRHSTTGLCRVNNMGHSRAEVPSWGQQGRLTGIALQSFNAILPSDLSFQQGDHITILTRTDTQFDWWEGTVNGRVGIFPANYIKVLDL